MDNHILTPVEHFVAPFDSKYTLEITKTIHNTYEVWVSVAGSDRKKFLLETTPMVSSMFAYNKGYAMMEDIFYEVAAFFVD